MRSYVLLITHERLLSDDELADQLHAIASFIRESGRCYSDRIIEAPIFGYDGEEVGEWGLTRASQ